jgi:uncharacterized Rossmann fold enzyme
MGPVETDPHGLAELKANRAVNCARRPKAMPKREATDGRVAVVGCGPSLADTWPLLVQQKWDAIWTTSKAHDFLLEKGIRPTHHTDVEWRAYKANYNTRASPTTRYVLATHIHPDYIAARPEAQVELFHVEYEYGGGPYEPGYHKVPVAFDAGLQAAQVAFQLGYREQTWFGFDASAVGETHHADDHPRMLPHERIDVEAGGRVYRSSNLLVRQALFCERMLGKAGPKMRVTITGDGLMRPFLQVRRRCAVR